MSATRSSEAVQRQLAPLGRFAEPALRFVIGQTTDAAIRDRLEEILADVQPK